MFQLIAVRQLFAVEDAGNGFYDVQQAGPSPAFIKA
jgi:hypothetical protein